jgi:hypothetical protein
MKMISEIYRVLSAKGIYIMITFGCKEYRMQYLEKPELEWSIKVQELPKPTLTATITQPNPTKPERNSHWVYICSKGKKNEQGDQI